MKPMISGVLGSLKVLNSGVPAAVDAGSTGCATYPEHRPFIQSSKLGIRAYLNVCSTGLSSLPVLEDADPKGGGPQMHTQRGQVAGQDVRPEARTDGVLTLKDGDMVYRSVTF